MARRAGGRAPGGLGPLRAGGEAERGGVEARRRGFREGVRGGRGALDGSRRLCNEVLLVAVLCRRSVRVSEVAAAEGAVRNFAGESSWKSKKRAGPWGGAAPSGPINVDLVKRRKCVELIELTTREARLRKLGPERERDDFSAFVPVVYDPRL